MKKLLVLILVAMLLLVLVGCGEGGDSETPVENPTPELTARASEPRSETNFMLYFTPVLEEYREFVLHGVVNNRNSNWETFGGNLWDELLPAGTPRESSNFGYALQDLNGNGIPDLILLSRDYTVFAIFSLVERTPHLLHRHIYWLRGVTEIGTGGTVFFYASESADEGISSTRQISPDGRELLLIESVENVISHIVGQSSFYRLTEQRERTEITEEEWQAITGRHWSIRTAEAGLTFIPLIGDENIGEPNYTQSSSAPSINFLWDDTPIVFDRNSEFYQMLTDMGFVIRFSMGRGFTTDSVDFLGGLEWDNMHATASGYWMRMGRGFWQSQQVPFPGGNVGHIDVQNERWETSRGNIEMIINSVTAQCITEVFPTLLPQRLVSFANQNNILIVQDKRVFVFDGTAQAYPSISFQTDIVQGTGVAITAGAYGIHRIEGNAFIDTNVVPGGFTFDEATISWIISDSYVDEIIRTLSE